MLFGPLRVVSNSEEVRVRQVGAVQRDRWGNTVSFRDEKAVGGKT